MGPFHDERIWRYLCTIWTVVFMVFVLVNFFSADVYAALTLPLSAVYAGVLMLYAGTKEFDRWYDLYDGRHPGEFFVGAWTLLILVMAAIAFFSGNKNYVLAPEVVADYIMVLSIFAITQKSKRIHQMRRSK